MYRRISRSIIRRVVPPTSLGRTSSLSLLLRHHTTGAKSIPLPNSIIIAQGKPSSFLNLFSSVASNDDGYQRWQVSLIDNGNPLHNVPSSSSSKLQPHLPPQLLTTVPLTQDTSVVFPSSIVQSFRTVLSRVLAYLLPAGYPSTVSSSYTHYATWSSMAMVFSSAGGVLATQSLLYAVGVGQGSIPLAATMNWVLKDGLGQFGGVLYAAFIGNKFDADPKRWRLTASIILDLATCLEILTPLFPGLFLPIAAFATFLKNVSWISASASRAGLHQSLAISGNLADITAKAGSQTIAASSLGTALGILLSPFVGSTPYAVFPAFMFLSLGHLVSLYQGLVHLSLPTLSINRLKLATINIFNQPLQTIDPSLARTVRTPKEVCEIEHFVPFGKQAYPLNHSSTDPSTDPSVSVPLLSSSSGPTIRIGCTVDSIDDLSYSLYICETSRKDGLNNQYVLGYSSQAQTIQLLYTDKVDWKNILFGYFHALQYRSLIRSLSSSSPSTAAGTNISSSLSLQTHRELLEQSRTWTIKEGNNLLMQLDNHGWWIGTPVIDLAPSSRIRIEHSTVT